MDLFAPSPRLEFSVSELVSRARDLLEDNLGLVTVTGEIGRWSIAGSGHAYFTLKDEQAMLEAVMFRSATAHLDCHPQEGMRVECQGRLTVYPGRGRMQLVAERLVPAGAGELARRFALLKRQLAAEGLFDSARKRPLPTLPRCLGLVTSPEAAALHDVLTVLRRRCPLVPILLAPAPVQGEGAAAKLTRALALLARQGECDVIILTRGGGSAEDLWAFNEEQLVRAVAACPVPVVSAVGHEVDLVLTDLAADVRAPTPSAAAELIVPEASALRVQLQQLARRLQRQLGYQLSEERRRAGRLAARLRDPRLLLAGYRWHLDDGWRRAERALDDRLADGRRRLFSLSWRLQQASPRRQLEMQRQRLLRLGQTLPGLLRDGLEQRRRRLAAGRRLLAGLDPRTLLERGFAQVTTADGRLLRSPAGLQPGDFIAVRLARGGLDGRVERLWDEALPDTVVRRRSK